MKNLILCLLIFTAVIVKAGTGEITPSMTGNVIYFFTNTLTAADKPVKPEHKAKRIEKRFNAVFNANPDTVFPLLCVRREREWIPGWNYNEIFSETGYMEEGLTYNVPGEFRKDAISYVSRYDKEKHHLTIIKFCSDYIQTISIILKENKNGFSDAVFIYQFTLLTEKGEKELDENIRTNLITQPVKIQNLLNAYLEKLNR